MKSANCIIFDCDGVLVDSEPLAALAYQKVYADCGMSISTSIMRDCIGLKQIDIVAKIAKMTGHLLPPQAIAEIWPETNKLFETALKATPGIKDYLVNSHLSRCVASSSSLERIDFSLRRTDLLDFFKPAIFSSSMVKNGKPAPDLFLFAAQQMSYAPQNCVVIEDSFLGVQGAVAAGMKAVGYVGGGHASPEMAEKLAAHGASAVCSTWREVAEALDKLGYNS